MAKTDRAAFLQVLREAEGEMTTIFGQLATELGQLVLKAQGPDGTVPVERLQQIQEQAGRLVEAKFLGGPQRRPFDDRNEPQAEYPRILAAGQRAMIDLALNRSATILNRYLPEDLQRRLSSLPIKR